MGDQITKKKRKEDVDDNNGTVRGSETQRKTKREEREDSGNSKEGKISRSLARQRV
jgi:hypothetical protein